MGISNLLPFLEKSRRDCHVSEFRGHTVAVDSYCWLHKGATSCALELARSSETNQYVLYCVKYIKMLLSHDIRPIMVFDGRHLAAKLKTEVKRRETRKQAKQLGLEQLRLGKTDEAYKYFRQCVDINPEMALNLIRECRKLGVDCIVAPYESDAQLAFFNLKGIAEVIITEDSDLLLFGCKKVLYKMDLNGCGHLVEADKINESMKLRPDQYSFDKFRHMCILSGCDYLDSLPGIGLKKALKFIGMTAETNPELFLDKVPRYLNMRHLVVTDEYKENFMIADATFQHQTVFDPFVKRLVPLTPIKTKIEYCRNAGSLFDDDEAFQLALGNLNPLTMERMDNWHPSDPSNFLSEYSIWATCFKHRPLKKVIRQAETPKRSHSLDIMVIEKINLERELQIEKELEFYKIKPKKTMEEAKTVPSKHIETSPVLTRFINTNNPFLKKRISKFSLTSTDTNVVKSRYFSSTQDVSKNETEVTTHCDVIEVQDTRYNETNLERVVGDCEEVQTQNVNMVVTEEVNQINEAELEQVVIDCDVLIPDESPCSPTLISVENIMDESYNKKRKLESQMDRFKKKPKKVLKKQITIQDMFRRMNE